MFNVMCLCKRKKKEYRHDTKWFFFVCFFTVSNVNIGIHLKNPASVGLYCVAYQVIHRYMTSDSVSFLSSAMMSVQTPPLSRSGSSPSNVGLANRSGPSTTPPTSLSLRSSYNQLLGRDVIKESMETGSSATLPKSRQRYAMTSVRSAMGISDNLALSSKNQPVTRGRGLPTKSSSSSALYSSSSSSSLFNTNNPKLAKNGANMQRRAESQQLELSRANTDGKIHNDPINNPSSDWLQFGKDNSQLPPFRRRTKSFLEYHGKGWDLDLSCGNKDDKEEKKQQPPPEKEQSSPAKERESQKEEKSSNKQTCQEEKEEGEPVVEEEEEEDDPTPTPRQPLLPVVVEAPLSPTSSSSSTNSPEWVPDHQNHHQNQAPVQVREELCAQVQASPRSPAKPPRSSQPRVIKVELHPNNENQFLQQYPPSSPKQARAAERNTPTRNRAPPALPDPEPVMGLPKVGLRMDLTPETPSEDEDSSWTTLSQETPSPQTPRETGSICVCLSFHLIFLFLILISVSAFNHASITPFFHSLSFSLPPSTSYRLSDLEIYQKPLLKC